MFKIETLTPPESVPAFGGAGTITLTHICRTLQVDPRSQDAALLLTEMKGYLDAAGNFVDFGDHTASAMDQEGLKALLSDTVGGKMEGAFSTMDIIPAIVKRAMEKKAAEEEAKADSLKPASEDAAAKEKE